MKTIVLIKKTPDTESKIKLTADNKAIDTGDLKYIINPYDEFAIEEALQIKEKGNAGEVIIAMFGVDSDKELIVKALAMGADRGLLIKADGLENADSLTVAKILTAAIKTENPDLVFCGKQAIDDDNMHVGTMVAELLQWPHVNVVNKVVVDGKKLTIEREIEGGKVECYSTQTPAVLGANKALNTPRYASLPGIMKAKKKPLDTKSPSDLGLNPAQLASGIKTVVKAYQYPPEKPKGKMFKGEPVEAMVEKVVKLLREEAKVI